MKYFLISFSFVILLGCSSSDIKIAFVSAPELYSEATHIHITNDKGTNEVKLTNGDALNSSPCWSPDNEKIAFVSNRDGSEDIYIMYSDGSKPTRITYTEFPELNLSSGCWSPDGEKMIFGDTSGGIFLISSGNEEIENITPGPNNNGYYPVWSPDGNKISFTSTRDGNEEVYIMNPDGSDQERLTNNPDYDTCYSWSPDSKKLACETFRNRIMQFYVMNADGSAKTDLIDAKDVLGIWRPEWSPTGDKILYTVIEKDYSSASLYIMNKDGTESRKLNINESNAQSVGVWANK